jgi:esterase
MFAKSTNFMLKTFRGASIRGFSKFTPAKLDHIFIPCKAENGKEAPNLIALHGVLGSSMNFTQIANNTALSSKVNSYLLDLRNHGKAEHKESMSYAEMANDVHQFILDNNLQDKENILLGFSMGARTAMEVAVTHPEIIKAVALEDLAPHNYVSDKRFNNSFVDPMNTMLKHLCQIDLKQDRKTIKKDIVDAAWNKEAAEVINSNVIPSEEGGYKWRLNIQSIYNNFLSQILSAQYTGYDVYHGPVKIIFGGQSEYTSQDIIPSFHHVFENFDEDKDIEVVDGAGHWVHYAQPMQFVKIISKFIDDVLKK